MSSIFTGKTGLRTNYVEMTFTTLNAATAATSQATAKMLCRMDQGARYLFIHNETNAEITFYAIHPEQDSAVAANRLLWKRMGAGVALNYDFLPGLGMMFDPGLRLFVSAESGAPSSGKIRIDWWG
jgi:hypothetical protein